jgi:hypothetical protein
VTTSSGMPSSTCQCTGLNMGSMKRWLTSDCVPRNLAQATRATRPNLAYFWIVASSGRRTIAAGSSMSASVVIDSRGNAPRAPTSRCPSPAAWNRAR